VAKIPGMAAVSTPQLRLPTTWSPQQEAVFEWVKNGSNDSNAIIIAVAGAGKTTTLLKICELAKGEVGFCAFNKKIADEIQARITGLGLSGSVRSQTFHAIGMRALGKLLGKLEVEADKTSGILEEIDAPFYIRAASKKLISLGKQSLVGLNWEIDSSDHWIELMDHYDVYELLPETTFKARRDPVEEAIEWAVKGLRESCAQTKDGLIDFDDMIYESIMLEAPFPTFDWVLLDEAQDTNAGRRVMAGKMLREGSRLVAVGDPHQAIYGFTGADSKSLDLIKLVFCATELPLTVTYRCPKAVVRHAHQWVSHIEAHESAPEGKVTSISTEDFFKLKLDSSDAILCRNNKPLVQLAFDFIRKKVACHIEGRDIGQGLITLMKKWKTVNNLKELHDRLLDYKETQVQRLQARGNHAKAASIADRVDTIFVLMENFSNKEPVSALTNLINSLFQDSEGKQLKSITLSTIHKAKGREWDRVYLWGRNAYMPSHWAKQEWELEQENNLCYVAVTRAKKELVEVTVGGEE